MKRNSYLQMLAIMMTLMACFGFVSCGSDGDSDGDEGGSESTIATRLQGTWQFERGTERVMGMTITMDSSSLSEMKRTMESMMGEKVEFWDETLTFKGSKVNGVDYTLNGDELILDGIDAMDGITITIKSLTSSTLVLHEVISIDGMDLTADMEYSRK